ncbi:hypothetical protein AB0O28_19140 [Microbispora sp. NPDC088329]|uniref:hypothetical protein n=1 Tax=Microbispora sp. NPDC088329 TaxID=3154869 RepID=UPI0034186D3C
MTSPQNTSQFDPLLLLADAMGAGGPSASIERMEAQGQRELVNSEVIPTEIQGGEDELTKLGFQLGEQVKDDPLFRRTVLPEGWKREPSDHSMWSYIVDELGRRRVAMFYKAAWYDRRADLSITTVHGYVSDCLDHDTAPILDDSWATREAVLAALDSIHKYEQERVEQWSGHAEDYAREYEREAREKLAKIEALRAELSGGETAAVAGG